MRAKSCSPVSNSRPSRRASSASVGTSSPRKALDRTALPGLARPAHWKGPEVARQAGAAKGSRAAKARRDELAGPIYRDVMPIILVGREPGGSLQEIADDLNARGFLTLRGDAVESGANPEVVAGGKLGRGAGDRVDGADGLFIP